MTLLLGAALAVFLIYLLRPPAQKVLVPSSLLWERLVKETANRRRLLRWLLSLLLSALIVLLLVSVVFRLEPSTGSLKNPILLVDNTGSMSTLLDPGTTEQRLDVAKRRATEILARSSGTITVADLAGTVGPVQLANAAGARRVLAEIDFVASATPRIPEHLLPSAGSEVGRVFLLSDNPELLERVSGVVSQVQRTPAQGRSQDDSVTPVVEPAVELVDVFRPAANVGIVTFESNVAAQVTLDRQPDSAYLEIVNGSGDALTALLRIDVFRASDLLNADLTLTPSRLGSLNALIERELSIAGNDAWSASIDLSGAHRRFPLERIAVRASVARTSDGNTVGDAQPADDTAWVVLEPRRTRLVAVQGVASLPRWLTRIITTSPELELVRAQPAGSPPAVHLYPPSYAPTNDEQPIRPCVILPPRLDGGQNGASTFSATAFHARLLTGLGDNEPLRLPWTEATALEAAGADDSLLWADGIALPTALSNQDATTSERGTVGNASSADALATANRVLVTAPNESETGSSCSQWLFDPTMSQLQTRAEFPALVEAMLATTAGLHRNAIEQDSWAEQSRQLVGGSWQPFDPNQPVAEATLRLVDSTLTVPQRLGRKLTVINRAEEADRNRPASTDASSATLADASRGSASILSWPSRTVLAALIIGLLLIEATTRFAGITE